MKRFSSNKVITIVLLMIAGVMPLQGKNLTDIRTGFHKTYSRLVLEFTGPVNFRILENNETPAVIVDIYSNGRILNFPEVNIDPIDPFIRKVRFKKNGNQINVVAFLKNKHFKIIQARMNYPFRIVVDIFSSGTELQTAVAHKTRATQKIDMPKEQTVALKPDSIPFVKSVSQELNDKQENDSSEAFLNVIEQVTLSNPIVEKFGEKPFNIESLTNPFKRKNEKVESSEAESKAKTNLIWMIGGAFVLFDLMLLAVYLLNRGKSISSQKAGIRKASRKRKLRKNVPKLKTAKQPSPVINKILNNEAMGNPEFLSMLNNVLEKQKQEPVQISESKPPNDELNEIKEAIKLDTLIGTLSDAIDTNKEPPTPVNRPPVPPEFKEIATDLNLGDSDEESAKRELIGKDGQEFMQNIKRLYLN